MNFLLCYFYIGLTFTIVCFISNLTIEKGEEHVSLLEKIRRAVLILVFWPIILFGLIGFLLLLILEKLFIKK